MDPTRKNMTFYPIEKGYQLWETLGTGDQKQMISMKFSMVVICPEQKAMLVDELAQRKCFVGLSPNAGISRLREASSHTCATSRYYFLAELRYMKS